MATVTLEDVWINDGDDPSDYLRLRFAGSLDLAPEVPGAVVVTASGRLISRTAAGRNTSWSVSSPYVPEADVQWLKSHAGRNVWVRDWLGERTFGVFFKPGITRRMDGSGRSDVSLTVDEVTPAVV